MIVHTHHISITPHELTMDEDSEIITAQKIIKVAFANIPTCTWIKGYIKKMVTLLAYLGL